MEYNIEELRKKYNVTPQATSTGNGEYDIDALRRKYNVGTQTPLSPALPSLSQDEEADQFSAETLKPTFAAKTGEGLVSRALKTVGNVPGSAFRFVKGALDVVNPVNTAKNLYEIATGIPEIAANSKYTGGAFQTVKDIGKDTAKTAYETVIPEAGRGLIEAGVAGAQGKGDEALDDVVRTTRAIQNDPVGQILPFLALAKGTAGALGKGKAFDSTISKVASPVTKATEVISSKVADTTARTTNYAMGQATGLNPDTIATIKESPKSFTKESMATIERAPLGQKVQSELSKRMAELDETGDAYKPIRNDSTPVNIDSGFLEKSIKDTTGLNIKKVAEATKPTAFKKGELPTIDMDAPPAPKTKTTIETTGASKLRDASDVRAVQHLYDLWQPVFERGKMTRNEFLNFRSDLAKLAKFERQIGKSAPIEASTKLMRAEFNKRFRGQIKGLDKLDESFSKQSAEYKELARGLVDKEGNLTDSAINKIANSTGKGKDLLVERLEQIVPGITKQVRILKAVEDIQHASGIKVGTYARGAVLGGSLLLAGPIQAVVTAILTSPEMAVPIIRRYGLIKNSNAIRTIVRALKSGIQAVNKSPEMIPLKTGAFSPKQREQVR